VIYYSIVAALKSGLFEEVMVSTDDEEIAEVAKHFGASVPFLRSAMTATDHAGTMDVINEVLKKYNENGLSFSYTCCIYPAAPFVTAKDLENGFDFLVKNIFDCVYPVVEFGHPIWKALERDESGSTKMIWSDNEYSRTQDFRKAYHDAGQWYWFKNSKFGNIKSVHDTGTLIISEMRAQDIDNLTDWKLAELKFGILTKAGNDYSEL
jgi:pseudaminic acid cytidylyltransferase